MTKSEWENLDIGDIVSWADSSGGKCIIASITYILFDTPNTQWGTVIWSSEAYATFHPVGSEVAIDISSISNWTIERKFTKLEHRINLLEVGE